MQLLPQSILEHFHHHPPKHPFPLAITPPPPKPSHPPIPRQPRIYFLSLQSCLLWTLHTHRLIHISYSYMSSFVTDLLSLAVLPVSHPCCSMCHYFTPFYGQMIFHWEMSFPRQPSPGLLSCCSCRFGWSGTLGWKLCCIATRVTLNWGTSGGAYLLGLAVSSGTWSPWETLYRTRLVCPPHSKPNTEPPKAEKRWFTSQHLAGQLLLPPSWILGPGTSPVLGT